MISYTAPSSTFAYPQFIYDSDRATIDAAHATVRLGVAVPPCYFQIDLIFGSSIFDEVVNAGSNYADRKLGAPYGTGSRSAGPYGGDADGTAPCSPKPVVTYRYACDGTFTAVLANDASANIDAVFIVAGQRVHVRPGDSVGARRHTGSLSIRDNTFTTHIASWEKPASCAPGPPATTRPAGPLPPASAGPDGSATALPPSAGSPVSLYPTYDGGGINPVPPTAAATTPVDKSDSSSPLIIALGVLMIIVGAVILVKVLRTFRRP